MFGTRCLLFVVAVTVAGCAGSMGTPIPGPSMPVSEARRLGFTTPATSFDGRYQTQIRSTGSFGGGKDASRWCESPGQPVITVTDGAFTYAVPHPNVPGNATPVFTATVNEDGAFSGSIVAGTMSGQIRGTQIEGRIDGSSCLYEFSGRRV